VYESNRCEAVQTNVIAAKNVVSATIANEVPRTSGPSAEEAVNPGNIYGATKLRQEDLGPGNAYPKRDSIVRPRAFTTATSLGGAAASSPCSSDKLAGGLLTLTNEAMTRYRMTPDDAADLVIHVLERMERGETFVLRISSIRGGGIADALGPSVPRRTIGIQPGDPDTLVIHPALPFWGAPMSGPGSFRLASATRPTRMKTWLDLRETQHMAELKEVWDSVRPTNGLGL
jgi:hypothetical protein